MGFLCRGVMCSCSSRGSGPEGRSHAEEVSPDCRARVQRRTATDSRATHGPTEPANINTNQHQTQQGEHFTKSEGGVGGGSSLPPVFCDLM